MRHLIVTTMIMFLLVFQGFAQSDLDFTQFTSLTEVEGDVQNVTDGIHAGLSALDWTDASAPKLFRISAGVFTGFGSFDAAENIGLKDGGVALGNIGAQVGFGTAGFEVYVRYFPELNVSDVKLATLGFGLKYELSSIIPVPLFPSMAVYADYNTLDFGVNGERKGTVPDAPGISYTTKAGIDLSLKTINIGLIVSKDLLLVRFYGKVAYELGNTDITWNSVTSAVGVPAGYITTEESVEFDNNGLRYGVGLSLFGIRAEVGGRGSNLYLGIGYGISI